MGKAVPRIAAVAASASGSEGWSLSSRHDEAVPVSLRAGRGRGLASARSGPGAVTAGDPLSLTGAVTVTFRESGATALQTGRTVLHDLIIDGLVLEGLAAGRDYADEDELLKGEYLPLLAHSPRPGGHPELSVLTGSDGGKLAVRWDRVRTVQVRTRD